MFLDDEFDNLFRRMSRPFMNMDDIFEEFKDSDNLQTYGPYYYGYTMTIGPDGKPVIKEYGNVKPALLPTSDVREPFVDVLVDDKEKVLKLVAEMPGVEKKDIKIVVEGRTVNLDAEHGEKKYSAKVPIRQKVDEDSVKATHANGILEVRFKLKEDEKPKGRTVEVE
ncbi:MAG: Hsp20/alpha crystallin family protein [Thaumarchaeota archaeon]|nr:Hsp20/alpha crystallin family protein [Nitrososphaerota archaeon]MBI3641765.1 Hsp20/alpha crystallin family protein [Nitrososphaerota archaeon]